MLSLRIDDKVITGLINKWLYACILDTDGQVIHPETGTPQGGTISPILANIYLHYALDTWFEYEVKPSCSGQAYLCRNKDDFICAFQHKWEAQRFFKMLEQRLTAFKLQLAEDKTSIIYFSRFQKTDNLNEEFLGFEFRWKKSRKGKTILKRRTARKKLRKSITEFAFVVQATSP